MSRRLFLKYSGVLSVCCNQLFVGTSTLFSSMNASAEMVLGIDELRSLFGIIKRMFPHKSLKDIHYQIVVEKLLEESITDPKVGQLIKDGISNLNDSVAKTMVKNTWVDSDPNEQLASLTKIEDTDFFSKLKSTTINSLYNDEKVWKVFGYEGEAFSQGGYLHRGFNDLNWLPEPPEEASPKVEGL